MGLGRDALKWFKERYGGADGCLMGTRPDVDVFIIDLMQLFKTPIPDDIKTLSQAKAFYMERIRKFMQERPRTNIFIFCVDQKATDHQANQVKNICYVTRYRKGDQGPYPTDGGPYLPRENSGQLPAEYKRFVLNTTLLRRELFPLIYNCLLDPHYMQLRFGQMIILQGFPARMLKDVPGIKQSYLENEYYDPTNPDAFVTSMQKLIQWDPAWLPITEEMERADPDLYNRVYVIEAVRPNMDARFPQGYLRTDEWKEARNNIGEADLAMVYFDRFFPDKTQELCINDGDIISIALLYAHERLVGNQFRNNHIIYLPKSKLFIDVNKLVCMICDDPQLGKAGVQNHIALIVLILVLFETDFFKGAFGGIGTYRVVVPTLLKFLPMFSHMVQLTKNVLPDPLIKRTLVIDEDRWQLFVEHCYVAAHGNQIEGEPTYDKIKAHLSKRKRPGDRMPARQEIHRWVRQMEWNMDYWINGPREKPPDPFLVLDGKPYYGYEMCERTGEFKKSTHVSTTRKPVDEVHAKHLHRRKPSAKRAKKEPPTKETLQRIEEMAADL